MEENERKKQKKKKNNLAVLLYNKKKRTISYSSKLGRPRGVLCFTGSCPNCMMTVDSCSNVRTCQYWSEKMPIVKKQGGGSFGGISSSFRFARVFHRFIPAGFQYHTLYSSKAKRRLFYSVLKKFTGLGPALTKDPKPPIKREKMSVELLVIGGGVAGISAALEGASRFHNVLLVESLPELGGEFYQRWNPTKSNEEIKTNLEILETMKNSLARTSNVEILLGTIVAAFYRIENIFLALSEEYSYEIQAKKVVICTGDHEILPIFDGNDSPRVMLSAAAQILSKSGVDIGSRVFILDMDGKGIELALDLKENGISTLGIARSGTFSEDEKSTCSKHGVATFERSLVSRVQKNGTVILNAESGYTHHLQVDLLIVSGRRQPNYELALQLGCALTCNYQNSNISNISSKQKFPLKISLGGRILNDKLSFEETIGSGKKAITSLAIDPAKEIPTIGINIDPDDYMKKAISEKSLESFICTCEDVSSQEFLKALAEGYDWVESLKRYTGALTGPCQGKQCALTVASLLAETTLSINQSSQTEEKNVNSRNSYKYFTTIRQPLVPVALAYLSEESENQRWAT